MEVMEITVAMFDCPLMTANTDLNDVHLKRRTQSKERNLQSILKKSQQVHYKATHKARRI